MVERGEQYNYNKITLRLIRQLLKSNGQSLNGKASLGFITKHNSNAAKVCNVFSVDFFSLVLLPQPEGVLIKDHKVVVLNPGEKGVGKLIS